MKRVKVQEQHYNSYNKLEDYSKEPFYDSYELKSYEHFDYKSYIPSDVEASLENPHRVANLVFAIAVAVFLLGSLILFLLFGWEGLQVSMILLGFAFVGGLVQAISEGQG